MVMMIRPENITIVKTITVFQTKSAAGSKRWLQGSITEYVVETSWTEIKLQVQGRSQLNQGDPVLIGWKAEDCYLHPVTSVGTLWDMTSKYLASVLRKKLSDQKELVGLLPITGFEIFFYLSLAFLLIISFWMTKDYQPVPIWNLQNYRFVFSDPLSGWLSSGPYHHPYDLGSYRSGGLSLCLRYGL